MFDIIQDNDRNFTALDIEPPEYLDNTGPVSCVYWQVSLGNLEFEILKYSE